MPWSPLIPLTVLFGVICGNRLLDNRVQGPFAAFKNPPTINAPSNEYIENKNRDLSPCHQMNSAKANIFYEFYGLKECDNVRKDTLSYGTNSNDYEVALDNSKIKREFVTGTSRNAAKSDMLSDMINMVVPSLKFVGDQPSSAAKDMNKKGERQEQSEIDVTTRVPSYSSTYFADYTEYAMGNELQNTMEKRANSAPVVGCDCKIKNDVIDLGQQRFPRYLLHAVCQSKNGIGYPPKCWRGSHCKPLEYNVKVLKPRNIFDQTQKEPAQAWLPDDLRPFWVFETVTVAAGCFCSY